MPFSSLSFNFYLNVAAVLYLKLTSSLLLLKYVPESLLILVPPLEISQRKEQQSITDCCPFTLEHIVTLKVSIIVYFT